MLRGEERKNRYAKLNWGRWRSLYTLRINCKGKRIVGKEYKGISVEKYNRLKKLQIKTIKKRKENKIWKKNKKRGKKRLLHRTAETQIDRGRGL